MGRWVGERFGWERGWVNRGRRGPVSLSSFLPRVLAHLSSRQSSSPPISHSDTMIACVYVPLTF